MPENDCWLDLKKLLGKLHLHHITHAYDAENNRNGSVSEYATGKAIIFRRHSYHLLRNSSFC